MLLLKRICPFCGEDSSIEVDEYKLKEYKKGGKAQDVWPEMTAGQRERIISGSHEKCFDEAFAEDDDDGSEGDDASPDLPN